MQQLMERILRTQLVLSMAVMPAVVFAFAQAPAPVRPVRPPSTIGSQGPLPVHVAFAAAAVSSGASLFQQNCAFCHGKDAGGGESGPDLTRSKLVMADVKGEGIGQVIRNGRVEQGMPRFNLADADVMSLVAYVHAQQDKAMSQTGDRKGVDAADLQTGDVQAGMAYFNGAGGCAKCHSPKGDLAGVATRYEGLKLEQQMLYPRDVKAHVTVTKAGGTQMTGTLAYQDEFTVALKGADGIYHSWPKGAVRYKIDDPAHAHVELFDKYTDADIHNLMAFLQTLR